MSRTPSRPLFLFFRPCDWVTTAAPLSAALYLALAARWTPGARPSAVVFTALGLGPPAFRALQRRFPESPVFGLAATFWLLPAVLLGHAYLDPLVDAFSPTLMDPLLAWADLRMLGLHASVWLERRLEGAPTELLLLCYFSYFVLPLAVAIRLYRLRQGRALDAYTFALSLSYLVNFAFYVAAPAIGPRFFLAPLYQRPLQGLWLTPWMDGMLRTVPFLRDGFPSGHAQVILIALFYAHRHLRRLFWGMLPVAAGLITATMALRFHYVVDVLSALPLTGAILWVSTRLEQLGPARLPRRSAASASGLPTRAAT